ncbi:hypothetical protein BHE74_00026477 [Ensete ventricosum]|nr:hypothetical protein BHE74_00026477 [Ensete ventricosum]
MLCSSDTNAKKSRSKHGSVIRKQKLKLKRRGLSREICHLALLICRHEFLQAMLQAKAERVRARAIEKMAEKLAMTQRQVDEKQAAARARMNKQASRTAHKAEHIRRTGQISSKPNYLCCGGFS